jgi:adenylate cyclase
VTDWESEGLLEGLETEKDRAGRRELLDRLHAEGCSVAELRQAAADERLVLLPIEKLLLNDRIYTRAEVAERTGVPREYLDADWKALGMSAVDEDQPVANDKTLAALEGMKYLMDAGVPEERLIELTRMVGDASARLADATLRIFGDTLLQPGDSESDLSLRLVDLANAMMPQLGELLRGPMELHLAQIVRQEAITRVERERGFVPGARRVAVCFADMVGFTALSEQLDPADLSEVTQRFVDVAGHVAVSPVRLVKTIGDEAMLASEEPAALVEAALELVETAERDDLLPSLRAGAAAGDALRRAGDYYGRPVNLAARITAVAPPDGLLANATLSEATGDTFGWTPVGRRGFKGIDGEVDLYEAART